MRHLMITLQVFTSCYALAAQKPYLVKCADDASKNCVVWTQGFTPKNVVCKVEGLNSYESIPGSDIKQELIDINVATKKEPSLIDKAKDFVGLQSLETEKKLKCSVDTDKRDARLDAEKASQEQEKEKRELERAKRKATKDELKKVKGRFKDLSQDKKDELIEQLIELVGE